jgi:hypothetical protein
MDLKLSLHIQDMLKERNIPEEWVWRSINSPDWENIGEDNNIHYFKSISEHEGRILHVVLNPHVTPKRVVTVFFDRRTRRKK